MKLPKLSKFFPIDETLADLYGGWLEGPFFKISFHDGPRVEQIQRANLFLQENGFETEIHVSDFEENLEVEIDLIIFSYKALGTNTLLLIYEQPLMSKPLDSLIELVTIFRDERDWQQFHTTKNLSMALSSEAGELLDLFLWDRSDTIDQNKASDELADVFIYLLLLAKGLDINLYEATINKIQKNSENYPVSKSKGSAKKYNEL